MAEGPDLAPPTGSENENRPTIITAPAVGRVSKKTVEVGQLVGPSQTRLSLVDEHDVWVVANLKETQLDEVKVGQPVKIDVDAHGADTTASNAHALVDH
jgi:membrane fusion protein (multidrug efflux system)